MFLYSLLISNNNFRMFIFTITIILLSFSLGRIIQGKISYKFVNKTISYPIGFFSYMIITGVFYFPFLFFKLPLNSIFFIEIIKNTSIIIYIFINNKFWFIKNNFTYQKLINSSIIIGTSFFSIIIFIFIEEYSKSIPQSKLESSLLYQPILNLLNNDASSLVLNIDTNLRNNVLIQNESQYYWFAIITKIQKFDFNLFMKIIIPILFIPILVTTIYGFLSENERNWYEFIISGIIIFGFVILLSYLGQGSQLFYVFLLFIFVFMLFLDYSNQKIVNNKNILIILISTIYLQFVTYWSIILIALIGIIAILYSIDKKTNISQNIFIFLILFIPQIFIYSIELFLSSKIDFFSTTLIYLFLIFFFGFLLLIPSYSIAFNNNRRQELAEYEEKIYNHRKKILITISSLLIFFALLIFILFLKFNISILLKYFDAYNLKLFISIPIYLITITIPSLLILFFNWKKNEDNLLNLISYINILLLNPFSFSLVLNILGLSSSLIIIYFPSLLILIFWIINELIKLIKRLYGK